ncbi:MAG TPA: hypothetical protein ENH85_13290 [Candidatus Scalindua sp.]|nr:hypothetical protein [Candidatus Scalindua sp.]
MNVDKLPKWAQSYIKDIERERETAIRALNEYIDNQTKSSFYIDEMECTGEDQGPSVKRRYIQTHKITVVHEKVELNIMLRKREIDLNWGGLNHSCEDVAFIPSTYQSARLVSKDNMS